jgi:hypothetical protein
MMPGFFAAAANGGSGPPPSGTWVPFIVQAVNAESGIPDDSTIRQVIPSGSLTPCTKVRVTVRSSPDNAMVVGAITVGQQAASGNFYDFAATPLAGAFSGSPGITIPANDERVTDAIDLVVSSGELLVVAIYMVSGRTFYGNASNGAFLGSGGNDVATVDASGYSEFPSNGFAVIKIECFVPD